MIVIVIEVIYKFFIVIDLFYKIVILIEVIYINMIIIRNNMDIIGVRILNNKYY